MSNEINYELYKNRIEPVVLSRLVSDRLNLIYYPSLREIKDKNILNGLIKELKKYGRDYVIISWISPPYGRIVGYGLYQTKEAKQILEKSQKEKWGFPRIGRLYDKKNLEDRIELLN